MRLHVKSSLLAYMSVYFIFAGGRGSGDIVGGRWKCGTGNLGGGSRGPDAAGRAGDMTGNLGGLGGIRARPGEGCRGHGRGPAVDGVRLCSGVGVAAAADCRTGFFFCLDDLRYSLPQYSLHMLYATGIKPVGSGVSMRRRM